MAGGVRGRSDVMAAVRGDPEKLANDPGERGHVVVLFCAGLDESTFRRCPVEGQYFPWGTLQSCTKSATVLTALLSLLFLLFLPQ